MNHRYYSLDIFRGATVALMILVNNPGSWGHIYTPLEHAEWHGCTPTDLVFPFFLFAVGTAMAFTMPRLHVAGTVTFLQKVFRRSVLIFLIGLLLNWAPFVRWEGDHLVWKSLRDVRIFGVLQRIALCYLFASLIVYFMTPKQALITSFAILLIYWIICAFAGTGDPYSLEGFWGTRIDRALLGNNHIYKGEGVPFDPEGLVSTTASIVQVVFGYFTGKYIRQRGQQGGTIPLNEKSKDDLMYKMITHLFVAGFILVICGLCWGLAFPVNKKIWTSSYVLYTTGIAVMILATLVYLIEIKEYRGWLTRFFEVFGKNPLFIFVLSGFLPRLFGLIHVSGYEDAHGNKGYLTPFEWFYEVLCKPAFVNLNNGSLLYAVCMIIFYWLIVYWLDRKKIYVRV